MHTRWRSLYPFDWDFRGCPREELPILYNYEFSRESAWIRGQVAFVRRGTIAGSTYWAPNPSFGWSWPAQSYLSIPERARLKRLYAMMEADARDRELLQILSPPPITQPSRRTGRASPMARYRYQLLALSVARLRVGHTASETLTILDAEFKKDSPFADVSALERSQRKAHRFLVSFVLKARQQLEHGRWFPPFGPYIVWP
jgi:hypothetical protein